jgi:hypothetical protein
MFYLDGKTVDSEICHVMCDQYSNNNSTLFFLFFKALLSLCWMKMDKHRKHLLFSLPSLFECIYMYVRCLCVFKERWLQVTINRYVRMKTKLSSLIWFSFHENHLCSSVYFLLIFLFVIMLVFCSLSLCVYCLCLLHYLLLLFLFD